MHQRQTDRQIATDRYRDREKEREKEMEEGVRMLRIWCPRTINAPGLWVG